MNAVRYIQILQSYGSDAARWPECEREAAIDFMSRFEEADQLAREASVLDDWLETQSAPAPSDILRAKIMAQAKAEKPVSKSRVFAPANDAPSRLGFSYRSIAATMLAGVFAGWLGGGFNMAANEGFQDYDLMQADAMFSSQTYDWITTLEEEGRQ